MSEGNAKQRPISPHVMIYSFPIVAVLSILHRVSGIFLLMLAFFIPIILLLAIRHPATYDSIYFAIKLSTLRFLVAVPLLVLVFHICSGIRHLFLDIGFGFDVAFAYQIAWSTIIASIVITLLLSLYYVL